MEPKNKHQSKSTPNPKKLYRSRKNRILGGVAGGIGKYFNVDPTLIRIIFVLLILFGGGGLFLYFILWLIIPSQLSLNEKEEENIKYNIQEIKSQTKKYLKTAKNASRNKESGFWLGLVFILFGIYLTLVNFGALRLFDLAKTWPIALISLGLILIFRA